MEIAFKVGPAFTGPPPDATTILMGVAFVAVVGIIWLGALAVIDRTI